MAEWHERIVQRGVSERMPVPRVISEPDGGQDRDRTLAAALQRRAPAHESRRPHPRPEFKAQIGRPTGGDERAPRASFSSNQWSEETGQGTRTARSDQDARGPLGASAGFGDCTPARGAAAPPWSNSRGSRPGPWAVNFARLLHVQRSGEIGSLSCSGWMAGTIRIDATRTSATSHPSTTKGDSCRRVLETQVRARPRNRASPVNISKKKCLRG